jgi:hypothetical protein
VGLHLRVSVSRTAARRRLTHSQDQSYRGALGDVGGRGNSGGWVLLEIVEGGAEGG